MTMYYNQFKYNGFIFKDAIGEISMRAYIYSHTQSLYLYYLI